MKKIIIACLVIFLAACTKDATINPPDNVEFNSASFILSWDDVSEATSYIISINDTNYETTNTSFNLSFLDEGDYQVKVRTLTSKGESRFTAPISITIPLTMIITYDSDIIHWPAIPNANKYDVNVYSLNNQLQSSVSVLEPSFNISDLIGSHQIEIIAYENEVELKSLRVILDVGGYLYSTNDSSFQMTYLDDISRIFINQIEIPSVIFSHQDDILIINGNYLSNLGLSDYLVMIDGIVPYYFILTVDNIQMPYLVSSPIADYTGSDIIFAFELYEGEIKGLTSSVAIEEDEYVIDNDEITILNSYLLRVKNEYPELNQVVLSYLLSNSLYSQYGYITINLS
jgi:hypothetical protein